MELTEKEIRIFVPMENFVVSARKYRPANFSTVVGQKSITQTLKNAIKTAHLAQAYLFTGPRGVGKTTTARIFAKTINCFNPDNENTEACNQCESCLSFDTNSSFNISELDAASNNSVDDIRQLVEQVRIPPQVGKFKIYIIDEVHMLSPSAFNAFLKTLEEPPSYVKFILATTERHKIIPTILSRCQVFNFNRITVKDMASHLRFVSEQEQVNADDDALHLIAEKADGALRDALSLFDQLVSFTSGNLTYEKVIENLHVLDLEYYFSISSEILKSNISSVLVLFNQIIDKGFDGQHFIIGLGEHLRRLMISKDKETIELMDTSDSIKQKYMDHAPLFDSQFLLACLDINNKADLNYRMSNNKRLLIELSLMQMCSMSNVAITSEKKNFELNKNPVPKSFLETSKTEVPNKVAENAPSLKKEKPLDKTESKESYSMDVLEKKPRVDEVSSKNLENQPEKRKIKRGFTKNLGYLLHEQDEKSNTAGNSNSYMIGNEDIADVIDKEKLQAIFDIFIDDLENQPSLQSVLKAEKFELEENFVISLKFYNQAQLDDFMKHTETLLMQLRTQLNNYKITIKTTILATKTPALSGPNEKFERMASQNPNLLKLKKQLNLEIDF